MNVLDTLAAGTRTTLTTDTGYTMANLRELENYRGGVAWNAVIKRNGAKVGTVEQDGNGGCNRYQFTTPAERSAFIAKAKEIYGEDAFEAEDQFAVDLSLLTQMLRKRSVVFFTDDQEPGDVRVFTGRITLDQAKTYLADPANGYAAKNPLVFDKAAGRFVPATA